MTGRGQRRLGDRGAAALLVAIVVASVALAAIWLVRVPIFGEPDENAHVDYALTIEAAGRLVAANEHPLGTDVSPATRLLARAGDLAHLRFDADGRITRADGTAAYLRPFDAPSPATRDWYLRATRTPYLAGSYPFGFYALEALIAGAVERVTGSRVDAFFAMRGLCLALLAATLVLWYAALRELRFTRALSLVLVASLGLSATIEWIFAYVQPDDLGTALVAAALLAVLRVRRLGTTVRDVAFLALALALLAAVKTPLALAATVAFVPVVLAARALGDVQRMHGGVRRALAALAIVLPALGVTAVVTILERHAATHHDYAHLLSPFLARGPAGIAAALGAGTLAATASILLGGMAFQEYAGAFSWMETPIVVGSAPLTAAAHELLELGAIAAVLLAAVRAVRACATAVRLARRGSPARALRLLVRDPLWNLSVVYLATLVGAVAYSGGGLKLHGRYLVPIALGLVVLGARYAPEALPARRRRPVAALFVAAALTWSVATAVAGPAALDARFYGPADGAATHSEYAIEIDRIAFPGSRERLATEIPLRTDVTVTGWGVDSHATRLAPIGCRVDGRRVPGVSGLPDETAVLRLNDDRLTTPGFRCEIPARDLGTGDHALTVFAVERGRELPFPGPPIVLHVAPDARRPKP